MAGLLWWELTHALCILGHLGLIIASFTAFAFTREVLGSDDFLSTKLVPFEAFGVVSQLIRFRASSGTSPPCSTSTIYQTRLQPYSQSHLSPSQ